MVHIPTQKVKVLRVNQKNAKNLGGIGYTNVQSKRFRAISYAGLHVVVLVMGAHTVKLSEPTVL